jgi:hypothetical protein
MRKWLANYLARLARRIYPESEEVMSFYIDRFTEMVIKGESNIKISVVKDEDMYENRSPTAPR